MLLAAGRGEDQREQLPLWVILLTGVAISGLYMVHSYIYAAFIQAQEYLPGRAAGQGNR